MNGVLKTGPILLFGILWFSNVNAAEPYVQFEAGILARDVVEEGEELTDLKFRGEAVSTRLLAKLGIELWEILNVYVQGGGADLSIDEFDNYDGDLGGAYGGGVRVNLYRSPFRDQLTLFVEGNTLRYSTDDKVRICTDPAGCGSGGSAKETADEEIDWNEYTVLFGASGRMEGFDLYGGIRLSLVDGEDRIRAGAFKSDLDLEEDDNFGIFFGVDVFLDRSEKTALNFEASIIDQDSFRAAIRREF
jgi:hypothetical protein